MVGCRRIAAPRPDARDRWRGKRRQAPDTHLGIGQVPLFPASVASSGARRWKGRRRSEENPLRSADCPLSGLWMEILLPRLLPHSGGVTQRWRYLVDIVGEPVGIRTRDLL